MNRFFLTTELLQNVIIIRDYIKRTADQSAQNWYNMITSTVVALLSGRFSHEIFTARR